MLMFGCERQKKKVLLWFRKKGDTHVTLKKKKDVFQDIPEWPLLLLPFTLQTCLFGNSYNIEL